MPSKGIGAICVLLVVATCLNAASSRAQTSPPPPFETQPSWFTDAPYSASCMAFGDFDLDGDLDLFFGAADGKLFLCTNQDGVLSTTPLFLDQQVAWIQSIVLGDVDGDGDPDLVCGLRCGRVVLYVNEAGTFNPTWQSAFAYCAESLALGDLDGDGDLDLVVGQNGQSAAFRNIGGTFTASSTWASSASLYVRSVALGDVDGDGDPDLVCGVLGQNVLYRNDAGILTSDPVWTSATIDSARTVALGDMDGDGDLDLVAGNDGHITIYRNEGRTFTSGPTWTSGVPLRTAFIDLGDVDGDGDLDLACAQNNGKILLFRNDRGVLPDQPTWLSFSLWTARGVALADLDGDGALDLVVNQSSLLAYRNYRSALAGPPAWTSGRNTLTRSVALADVDRDGDLDLVCGNIGLNTLYRNDDGIFTADPVWTASLQESTTSVALADVDGDGDLDAAFGGYDKQSTLYSNNGSTFSSDPVWFSGREHDYIRGVALGDLSGDGRPDLVTASNGGNSGGSLHFSAMFPNQGNTLAPVPAWLKDGASIDNAVALGDLDGDGDLDLALAGRISTVFRNESGVLSAHPTWKTSVIRSTNSIALGDVDGDGDLDLALGELGNCRLYRNDSGQLTADFVWSNTGPTPLYARNLAFCDVDGDGDLDLLCADAFRGAILYRNDQGAFTFDAVWAQDSTDATYWVAAGDVDDDGDLDVVAGNALVGGPPRSSSLFLGVRNPPLKGDPASPVNQLPNTDPFLRRLRTVASPNRIHVTGLAIDPESDPVWIVVDYQYKGSSNWAPVEMGAVAGRLGPLPSSPVGTAFQFDWNLSDVPFDTRDVVLRCRVISNPMRVGVSKQIVSYLKELGPITNIVRPMIAVGPDISFPTASVYDTARATCRISNKGTDVLHVGPVTLTGTNDAWAEPSTFDLPPRSSRDVTLFWRPTSENPGAGSIEFPSNDPINPLATVRYNVAIRRVQFTVTATAGEITQGIPVTALVTMLDSVRVDSVLLAYHAGGQAEDARVKLAKIQEGKNDQWFGAIPAESLRASGIEYVVEAYKGPARFPDTIRRPRVRITNLSFPESQPARSYTMLSIPLQTSGSIFDILSDDLGPPLPTSWRIFTYEPADSSYKEASASGGEVFDFEQGRSYWLISSTKATLDLEPRSGLSTPLDSAFVWTLKPGWNQVGDPFAFPVPWAEVTQASNIQGPLVEPPLRWVRAARTYAEVDSLLPFEGCFIKNNDTTEVVLRVPSPSVTPAAPARASRSEGDMAAWQMQIVASCGDLRDAENTVGVQRGAAPLRDPWDRSDPPLGPWGGISVYFPHQDPNGNSFYLTRDFQDRQQATGPDGHQWSFDLFRSPGSDASPQEIVLRFQGLEQVPADLQVVLLDRILGREIDLRTVSDYSFFQAPQPYRSEPEARFRLLAGSPEYVRSAQKETEAPKLTRLLPSRPNPFRSASVIRYDLATAGPVLIQIFDVRGRLLKTIDAAQDAPGRYEVMWRGETDRGGTVPAGVYFCRFSAPSVHQTLKMIRVE